MISEGFVLHYIQRLMDPEVGLWKDDTIHMTEQERERELRKRRMRSRMVVAASDEGEEQDETVGYASDEDDGYESRLFQHRLLCRRYGPLDK